MNRKLIKLKRIPNKDILKDLLELFVYYNLSYPTGQREECTIQLDDVNARILTHDKIYKLTDELYIRLYQLSNKVIANLYKIAEDDFTI